MPGMMDNVKTLNSVLRTLIALVVVGIAVVASWLGISTYYAADWDRQAKQQQLTKVQNELKLKEQTIADQIAAIEAKDTLLAEQDVAIRDLNTQIVEKDEEIARLDTAMRLLKVDHRLADIKVLDIGAEENGDPFIDVTFQEINDEGQPIDKAREFRLKGTDIRVDSWQVNFEDKYIEQADLHRSTTICLFQRIYGNKEGPTGGHSIESIGTRPTAYARGKPLSDFEKQIWDDFWTIANDKKKAEELGIRAATGKSDFVMPDRKGKTYRVELRASGGTSLVPLDDQ
jgi:uncharacterized coiled-coil protein SlyX